MSNALFLILYWSILTIPGAALNRIIDRNQHNPLSWIALSYTCFVLIFISANHFQLSVTAISIIVITLVSISLLTLIAANTRRSHNKKHNEWARPTLVILAASATYQIFFGAFSEVPSDLYSHLERLQFANRNILNNTLGPQLEWSKLLRQKSGVFYYLVSFVNQLTNLDTRSLVGLIDFSNRTLFLLAVFFFAKFLFRRLPEASLIAYLATVFVATHMGISVFSFVRYYSFAPTILAMIIYFFAISLFLEQIKGPFKLSSFLSNSTLVLLSTIAAAAVHTQEAMFIAVMALCISLVASLSYIKSFDIRAVNTHWQANLVSIAGILGFAALYIYSSENLIRAANAHWRLWEFGEGFWFIPQLTTLNLKLQFIQVVTLWGVMVYALFLINIKRYRNNLFLLAGMLSPIITFLNPFFIDAFLRNYNSTTVWRLCYLLPIHFVAADLFVHYANSIKSSSIYRKSTSTLVIMLFLLLLTPLNNTWVEAHYSRAPTLASSDIGLSYTHYNDLLDFLGTLPKAEQILTDPMLGYMISGLTKHYSERRKFFRNQGFKRFSYYNYDDRPLDRYAGYLLVTSQRKSDESDVGASGEHWRKNEWIKTQNYYPKELLKHLKERPDVFNKLWSNDGITVYRINPRKARP